MKLKLCLFLPLLALMLGVFGASFSLDSYADSLLVASDGNYNFYKHYSDSTIYLGSWGDGSYTYAEIYWDGSTYYSGYYYIRNGSTYSSYNGLPFNVSLSVSSSYIGSYNFTFIDPNCVILPISDFKALSFSSAPPTSVYDDSIVIESYHSYWLGTLTGNVVPVWYGSVSDNVDHIETKVYWDDLSGDPFASFTTSIALKNFFQYGSSVPFDSSLHTKMVFEFVPYDIQGNYGATYYSTVTPFNLNNTYTVSVPTSSGGTGTIDFNRYTQCVNSFSPTNNISTSTVLDTTYNRVYEIDNSTTQDFYENYDYSTVDKSFMSNNDITFNTTINLNIPSISGNDFGDFFHNFNFGQSIDLVNAWIPGVPLWFVGILTAGIALIIAAVIAKILFEIF